MSIRCATAVFTDYKSGILTGRWPAQEAAFRNTKAALGCQLAEALCSSFGASATASKECVDVLSDGFAFRLFLWSTRYNFIAGFLRFRAQKSVWLWLSSVLLAVLLQPHCELQCWHTAELDATADCHRD